MSKEPNHDYSAPAFVMALGVPLGLVVADLIGRIREFFIGEWPYISWGLFILISAATIGWVFVHFINSQEELDTRLTERIEAIESDTKSERNRSGHQYGEVQRRIESLKNELIKERGLRKELADKVEELLLQKGPITSPVEESITDPAVQDAIEEIVEGLA